jgi:cytochrome P450
MLLDFSNSILIVTVLSTTACLVYIVRQRFFHPLAQYPGPFWATITDAWQVFQFLTLKQPYKLTELHAKYGPVVRYGPNNISITHEEAVASIYQAASKSLPKTEFYDAFGGAHPNVFGTRDEVHHSIRRRHMSHAFSMTSIKDMEQYLDENIAILRQRITEACHANHAFDLKDLLHNYVIDVLGELAFSKSFDLQKTGDRSQVPPVKEHTLLGSALGAWPSLLHWLKWALPKLPIASIQSLFEGRRKCAELAARCVQNRLHEMKTEDRPGESNMRPRKDLLTTLIRAKHPETGARLTQMDLETEAFGFM